MKTSLLQLLVSILISNGDKQEESRLIVTELVIVIELSHCSVAKNYTTSVLGK